MYHTFQTVLAPLKMSKVHAFALIFVLVLVFSIVLGFKYDPTGYDDLYDDNDLDDQGAVYGIKEVRSKPQFGVKSLERLLWPFAREYASVLDSLAIDQRTSMATGSCGQSLAAIADGIRKKRLISFKSKCPVCCTNK